MTALNVLDLFSGIGGFSLGLERTGGFRTVAFCEIEEYPRRVLAKHWPGVPCYDDVRTLTADRLRTDGVVVDVICGGFPCQDISTAGHGAGLEGERSGLWFEYARLIGELRPRYVIVENVAALLVRGLDRVLGSLAALGYDAEWHCIPAAAVGAPHRRDRVWIVGYPEHARRGDGCLFGYDEAPGAMGRGAPGAACRSGSHVAYPASEQRNVSGVYPGGHRESTHAATRLGVCGAGPHVADASGSRREQSRLHLAGSASQDRQRPNVEPGHDCAVTSIVRSDWWQSEPDVGRVADGVPRRVDRLRGLGNAVVPQIPELIGRAILAAHEARAA